MVCEKPLCFTSAEAEELVSLAKANHKVVGVTYGYSGHQMIRHGGLEEIRVVNMSFAFGGYNVESGAQGVKWVEKSVESSRQGPAWGGFN